jgi:IPT/TIG domain
MDNRMKAKRISFLTVLVLILVWTPGCEEKAPPSAYDPGVVGGPQPVITSIDPQGSALANVTTLTIHGQNFSTVPGENLVFFDATVGTVTQASATQLQLKAPNLVKDTIVVKVAVQASQLFSSPVMYRLNAAALEFGNFQSGETPAGVECDLAGNVYVSIASSQPPLTGVKKITPAGDRSDYSPPFTSSVSNWRNMRFGPGGAMYCVAGRNIIFSIPAGGGNSGIWLSGSGLTTLYDLDFDDQGNLWAVGPAGSICRARQDKNVKTFPFVGTIRAARVYNGFLYVGGKRDSLEKIWRLPIVSADSLGAVEEYFNLSSLYGANSFGVQALTFAADGDLYVGTDASDGIVVVHPNGTSEPLYPGVIESACSAIAWGSGNEVYQARTGSAPTLVRIDLEKAGAPYFGRTLP